MAVTAPTLAEWLTQYDRLVEVGIGTRPAVAATLARNGRSVTATDIRPVQTPPGVQFVIDDITAPRQSVYATAEILYARRLPAELQRPVTALANRLDIAACFTTLGGELPVVEATTQTLAETTVYQSATPSSATETTAYGHR